MSKTVDIDAVRHRRDQARREADTYKALYLARDQECGRLDVTIEEMERFVEGGELAPDDGPDLSRREVESLPDGGPVSRTVSSLEISPKKPDGLPTLRQMVMAVLQAEPLGGDGLEPREITAKVRERFWKEAPNDSIGPTASRMVTETKELERRGGKYFVRRDAEGGTLPFGEPKTVGDMTAVGEA